MSTVATVSLAVIAATCLIVMGAILALAFYVWRLLSRVEAVLAIAQRTLPDLATEARAILVRVDRDILGEVSRTVGKATAVLGSGIDAMERAGTTARRLTQSVVLPQLATAAGLLAAIREGLTWLHPSGDGRRR